MIASVFCSSFPSFLFDQLLIDVVVVVVPQSPCWVTTRPYRGPLRSPRLPACLVVVVPCIARFRRRICIALAVDCSVMFAPSAWTSTSRSGTSAFYNSLLQLLIGMVPPGVVVELRYLSELSVISVSFTI